MPANSGFQPGAGGHQTPGPRPHLLRPPAGSLAPFLVPAVPPATTSAPRRARSQRALLWELDATHCLLANHSLLLCLASRTAFPPLGKSVPIGHLACLLPVTHSPVLAAAPALCNPRTALPSLRPPAATSARMTVCPSLTLVSVPHGEPQAPGRQAVSSSRPVTSLPTSTLRGTDP